MELSNNWISLAGEFAVLSELFVKGFDATVTFGYKPFQKRSIPLTPVSMRISDLYAARQDIVVTLSLPMPR